MELCTKELILVVDYVVVVIDVVIDVVVVDIVVVVDGAVHQGSDTSSTWSSLT